MKDPSTKLKKILVEIETSKKEIEQFENNINNINEETNPELYNKEFILIKHYLKAKLTNQMINDTIDMIFDENMKYLRHNPIIFD